MLYVRVVKQKYIEEVRSFNRFYTSVIGLLDKHILHSPYSLPESRIMFELYHHDGLTAGEVIEALQIDKGYLSRIIRDFEKKKLLIRKVSGQDARAFHLHLTTQGKKEFEALDLAAQIQLKELLSGLPDIECDKLVRNMREIRTILSKVS